MTTPADEFMLPPRSTSNCTPPELTPQGVRNDATCGSTTWVCGDVGSCASATCRGRSAHAGMSGGVWADAMRGLHAGAGADACAQTIPDTWHGGVGHASPGDVPAEADVGKSLGPPQRWRGAEACGGGCAWAAGVKKLLGPPQHWRGADACAGGCGWAAQCRSSKAVASAEPPRGRGPGGSRRTPHPSPGPDRAPIHLSKASCATAARQ